MSYEAGIIWIDFASFRMMQSGGLGGEAPQKSKEVWGAAGSPMMGTVTTKKQTNKYKAQKTINR